jgi:hypothetical protein
MKVSDVQYFNDSAISNSDLGVLKDSPWYFRQYKDKKVERVDTSFFELGTLIHMAILEPDLFVVANIDKPGGMMGKFIDVYVECGMNKEAEKEAYKQSGFKYPLATVLAKLDDKDNKKYLDFIKDNHNKLVLTKQQKWVISQVEKGIYRNPSAQTILFDYEEREASFDNKVEIFNELELYGLLDGVRIKGKIDKLIIDHKFRKIILVDLKSTSSAPYFRFKKVQNTGELTIDYQGTGFFNSFKGWCYYRQMAFYKRLIAENYKELFDKYSFECYMVVVNTTQSYDCSVVKVSDDWLNYGRAESEELIARYKMHEKENNWMYPILDSSKGMIKL